MLDGSLRLLFPSSASAFDPLSSSSSDFGGIVVSPLSRSDVLSSISAAGVGSVGSRVEAPI